jgi:hypothetical protein
MKAVIRNWIGRATTESSTPTTEGNTTHTRTRTFEELLREYEGLQCFIRFWIEVIADTSIMTVRTWAQPISARLIQVLAAYRDELSRRIIGGPTPEAEDWLRRIEDARLLSLLLTAELLELCPEARHPRPYTHLGLVVRQMLKDAYELFTMTILESQGSAA